MTQRTGLTCWPTLSSIPRPATGVSRASSSTCTRPLAGRASSRSRLPVPTGAVWPGCGTTWARHSLPGRGTCWRTRATTPPAPAAFRTRWPEPSTLLSVSDLRGGCSRMSSAVTMLDLPTPGHFRPPSKSPRFSRTLSSPVLSRPRFSTRRRPRSGKWRARMRGYTSGSGCSTRAWSMRTHWTPSISRVPTDRRRESAGRRWRRSKSASRSRWIVSRAMAQ